MAAGQTTVSGTDAQSNPVSILAGSDGTHVALGHTLFDANGAPVGVPGNPLYIKRIASTPVGVSQGSITTANQYQQVLAAGASLVSGGMIFADANNSGPLFVDTTGATGTTFSSSSIPVLPGTSINWPAITTPVAVWGPAGALFYGCAG